MAQSKFRISFIYASYRGPMIPWIRLGENKNLRMQIRYLGLENTSWIRKYHKYDEMVQMDRKIRNCDIFSAECKKLDGNA